MSGLPMHVPLMVLEHHSCQQLQVSQNIFLRPLVTPVIAETCFMKQKLSVPRGERSSGSDWRIPHISGSDIAHKSLLSNVSRPPHLARVIVPKKKEDKSERARRKEKHRLDTRFEGNGDSPSLIS